MNTTSTGLGPLGDMDAADLRQLAGFLREVASLGPAAIMQIAVDLEAAADGRDRSRRLRIVPGSG